ncbi:MAG: helix-turn-helix domain-containing protein [Actinomycetota bacterium]|nr:helix-turn-helix domain-containing protein [Actinomycetota bacterium]
MTVCEKLSDAVVQNADAAELTQAFALASGQAVVLLDPDCRPIAEADGGLAIRSKDHHPTTAQLRMLAGERRPVRVPGATGSDGRCWLVTPIVAVDKLLGYLLVISEPAQAAGELQVVVSCYVASMFAVTLAREKMAFDVARRRRSDLLNSFVTGRAHDDVDAQDTARALGLCESGTYRIAIARPMRSRTQARDEDTDVGNDLARLAETLPFAAVVRAAELVMLVAAPPHDPAARASAQVSDPFDLVRAQRTGDAEFAFGLSEHTVAPQQAPQALAQARRAADLGVRLGRVGQAISYADLGIHRLLLQIDDLNQLHTYAREVLGPLIDYDAAHKPDLVHTLSTYLSQHESPKQTARMLRVHVNTVCYRIQRIESLTSLDLNDSDDRLCAHAAVKIVESLRGERADRDLDRSPVAFRANTPTAVRRQVSHDKRGD